MRRKYRNVPTLVDGVRFDSKREAARWTELRLLQKAGQIRDLERQITYPLIVNGVNLGSYRADFVYNERQTDCDGEWWEPVVEDVKGFKTASYNLKKKLMRACHMIEIRETK